MSGETVVLGCGGGVDPGVSGGQLCWGRGGCGQLLAGRILGVKLNPQKTAAVLGWGALLLRVQEQLTGRAADSSCGGARANRQLCSVARACLAWAWGSELFLCRQCAGCQQQRMV